MKKSAKVYYIENKAEHLSDFETTFELQPLERGFANTLGNSLRRTILSSVPSVAVFGVKIEGVEHEFSVIDKVREDVVTILNNLKKLRFSFKKEVFLQNEIQVASFDGRKVGKITGADILVNSALEIVNKDQVVANTSEVGALKFEMFLTYGRGFVDFETNKRKIQELGPALESKLGYGQIIAVDSDFSAVENVKFSSTELNSSNPIVEEKLTFSVKTDGTILAKDALAEAAKILIAHLKLVSDTANLDAEVDSFFEEVKQKEEAPKKNSADLTTLDLTVRSLNALRRAQHYKISDLLELTLEELENIKNLGKKSVEEIVEKLKEHNLELKKGE